MLDGDVPDGPDTSQVKEALDDDGEEAGDQDEQLQNVSPYHGFETALERTVKNN